MNCCDVGFDCDGVVRGDTEEETLTKVAEHAQSGHGLDEVTPDVVAKVKSVMREEPAPPEVGRGLRLGGQLVAASRHPKHTCSYARGEAMKQAFSVRVEWNAADERVLRFRSHGIHYRYPPTPSFLRWILLPQARRGRRDSSQGQVSTTGPGASRGSSIGRRVREPVQASKERLGSTPVGFRSALHRPLRECSKRRRHQTQRAAALWARDAWLRNAPGGASRRWR